MGDCSIEASDSCDPDKWAPPVNDFLYGMKSYFNSNLNALSVWKPLENFCFSENRQIKNDSQIFSYTPLGASDNYHHNKCNPGTKDFQFSINYIDLQFNSFSIQKPLDTFNISVNRETKKANQIFTHEFHLMKSHEVKFEKRTKSTEELTLRSDRKKCKIDGVKRCETSMENSLSYYSFHPFEACEAMSNSICNFKCIIDPGRPLYQIEKEAKQQFKRVMEVINSFQEFDSIYIEESFQLLKQSEKKYLVNHDYFKYQTEITLDDRAKMVLWLVYQAFILNLRSEVVHLAVLLMDRIFSFSIVSFKDFALLGTTCLYLAAKIDSRENSKVNILKYMSSIYSREHILIMEKQILRILDFDINIPTAMSFAEMFTRICSGSNRVRLLAQYICELSLLRREIFCAVLPSCLGVAAACLACFLLGEKVRIEDLRKVSIPVIDLEKCIKCLQHILSSFSKSECKHNLIIRKYSFSNFLLVSSVEPKISNNLIVYLVE